MEGKGEHTHETIPVPPVPVVAPVVDATNNELVDPVIDHTEKITRIEEKQAQHQEEMYRQLRELEERLQTASASQVSGLTERIAALEGKIEASGGVPDETVELTLPDVETSPAPPEKMRQSMRERRKARRKK